jgi:outer membrane immunogenic protein
MKFLVLAATALMATATPALAQDNANFTGVRVEATAGYDDVINANDRTDIVYGGAVGFDLPVGSKYTIGVDANTSNIFESRRQIGASARIGYAFNAKTLGYVRGGYNNYRNYATISGKTFRQNLDGAVIGAGVQYAVTNHAYIKAEYRYSNFANGVGDSGVVAGVGLRF